MEGGDKPGGWVRAVSVTVPSFPLLDMRTSHVSPVPSCPSGSRHRTRRRNFYGDRVRQQAHEHRAGLPAMVRLQGSQAAHQAHARLDLEADDWHAQRHAAVALSQQALRGRHPRPLLSGGPELDESDEGLAAEDYVRPLRDRLLPDRRVPVRAVREGRADLPHRRGRHQEGDATGARGAQHPDPAGPDAVRRRTINLHHSSTNNGELEAARDEMVRGAKETSRLEDQVSIQAQQNEELTNKVNELMLQLEDLKKSQACLTLDIHFRQSCIKP